MLNDDICEVQNRSLGNFEHTGRGKPHGYNVEL